MGSGPGGRTHFSSDNSIQRPVNAENPRNLNTENGDAICMRTRARYSLSSFTLDELETFLQETDDEDDEFKNVDDDEEYRKFLAYFVHGCDGDGTMIQECENIGEEDEEDDTDFLVEIEEALESDLDGEMVGSRQKRQTRLNKRKEMNHRPKKVALEFTKRPLRPLVPIMPVGAAPLFTPNANCIPGSVSCNALPTAEAPSNCFTPHQIGQLHFLVYEHVQLLVQIFALCIFEPSRQHIASQTKEMLFEVLHKRDEVLKRRNSPHPSFCFPSHSPPLAPHDPIKTCEGQNIIGQLGSSSTANVRSDGMSDGPSSLWVPFVDGPIMSVLDVAPIGLVGKFMDEVTAARQEYQMQYLEAAGDALSAKEPLFPFSIATCFNQVEDPSSSNAGLSPPPSSIPPKKMLATALVENSKKQSVASVPMEIANLAQRFIPLFNSALYPHKPPSVPVASRVLFTEAEDQLLALGLMEYNTDWKAIQQRFLPCKSKHQIFVRQKNRCSSNAPENCIKAVRRVKTSPLTDEEIARIHEGLKVFKLDWMSIWKFVVPYRDPSLLTRQWRMALGTQKSYKADTIQKAKRRLYAAKRGFKAAVFPFPLTVPEEVTQIINENRGCTIQNDGNENKESFLHEAFLADWRPTGCSLPSGLQSKPEWQNPEAETSSSRAVHCVSFSKPGTCLSSKPSKPLVFLRPYRTRKSKTKHLVKLAPDLPPVNLPSSVRIISQSEFDGQQGIVRSHCAEIGAHSLESSRTNLDLERDGNQRGHIEPERQCVREREGNVNMLEPQLHPLLFQTTKGTQLHRHTKSSNDALIKSNEPFQYFHPLLVDSNASEAEGSSQKSTYMHSNNVYDINMPAIAGEKQEEIELEAPFTEAVETTSSGDDFVAGNASAQLIGQRINEKTAIFGSGHAGRGVMLENITEDSSAGIVMEQEELSDSEIDEENIEFEYEEIADSEREDDAVYKQTSNSLNQETGWGGDFN